MPAYVDPRVRALAEKFIAERKNRRAVTALRILLDKGVVSTDDLQELGYNHPPRAIADIRDAGIPIASGRAVSARTGRQMAVYRFGAPEDIRGGRIGGRSAFPKSFKRALIERYGAIDCITRAPTDERILQIDHRVPFRIAGETGIESRNVEDFMLQDGSSQRAKSWSCEHCPNTIGAASAAICESCFWASPEKYEHVATNDYRRTDIVWQGDDAAIHDSLSKEAKRDDIDLPEFIRRLARQRAKRS